MQLLLHYFSMGVSILGNLLSQKGEAMKRREFVQKLGAGTLVAGGLLSGCDKQEQAQTVEQKPQAEKIRIRWKMVTTWPKDFPGLGTGANTLARVIGEMSGGRLQVKVYGAGELVPALQVFDAVSQGTAEMGHGAAYYWKGKTPSAQFFAAVPFGLTAQEMNRCIIHFQYRSTIPAATTAILPRCRRLLRA